MLARFAMASATALAAFIFSSTSVFGNVVIDNTYNHFGPLLFSRAIQGMKQPLRHYVFGACR
jgi:hypothetical protein